MAKLLLLSFLFALVASQLDYQLNDIKTLNYALTLENLEYTFYQQGLTTYNVSTFASAGYNSTVYAYIMLIRDHEQAHVNYLNSAITSRGGTPVPVCTYNFPYTNVSTFLSLASALENTGVKAYDGAINTLSELGLQTVAATVATVEARHAAYLNLLIGANPFPSAFDNATSPSEILAVASTFIVSCSNANLGNLPVPANFTANVPFNASIALANDLNTLNFALYLEDLENNFYNQGVHAFNGTSFVAYGYNSSVFDYVTLVSMHEATHATFLRGALGSNAVQPCTYTFDFGTNVTRFLQLAQIFENTGVSAYDGAVNAISNLGYRTIAATIATVEARHASYFNQLLGMNPFPNALDPTATPSAIAAAVAPFISGCPTGTPAPLPVPANFSAAAQNGGSVSTTGSASTSGTTNPTMMTTGTTNPMMMTTGTTNPTMMTTGTTNPAMMTTGMTQMTTGTTNPTMMTTGTTNPTQMTTGMMTTSRATTLARATTSKSNVGATTSSSSSISIFSLAAILLSIILL